MGNAKSIIQDLNSGCCVHFLWQWLLHYKHPWFHMNRTKQETQDDKLLWHCVQSHSDNSWGNTNARLHSSLLFSRTTLISWRGETCTMGNCWPYIQPVQGSRCRSGMHNNPMTYDHMHAYVCLVEMGLNMAVKHD